MKKTLRNILASAVIGIGLSAFGCAATNQQITTPNSGDITNRFTEEETKELDQRLEGAKVFADFAGGTVRKSGSRKFPFLIERGESHYSTRKTVTFFDYRDHRLEAGLQIKEAGDFTHIEVATHKGREYVLACAFIYGGATFQNCSVYDLETEEQILKGKNAEYGFRLVSFNNDSPLYLEESAFWGALKAVYNMDDKRCLVNVHAHLTGPTQMTSDRQDFIPSRKGDYSAIREEIETYDLETGKVMVTEKLIDARDTVENISFPGGNCFKD